MRNYYFFILFILLSIAGCSKESTGPDSATQLEIDKQKIRNYLNDNNLKADSTAEGLYYIIDYTNDTLENIYPLTSSTVTVDYKGYLLDGSVFQTNYNVVFNLSEVIDGWKIGIPRFKQGEKGRLFIPSKLGYGNQSTAEIPANSPLVFEVTLIKVQK